MQKMSEQQVKDELGKLSNWQQKNDSIEKSWEFVDFGAAMAFINNVADVAESHDHHPEMFNVYNKVKLTFTTHDVGGLSEKDFKIAHEIDKI